MVGGGGNGRKRPLGDDRNNDAPNKCWKYDFDRLVKLPLDEPIVISNLNDSKNLQELDFIINGTNPVYTDTKSLSVDNIKENLVRKEKISVGTKEKKQNVLHIVKNLIAVGSNSKMELKSTVQNKGKIDCNNYGTKNVQKKKTKKKENIPFDVEEKKKNVLHNVENLIAIGSNNRMELDSAVQNKNKRKIDCNINGTKNVQNKKTLVRKIKKKKKCKKNRPKKKTSIVNKSIPTKRISVKSVPENSVQKDNVLCTESLFELPKEEHLLTLLKIHCINGISESCLPISKPPPCNCPFCMQVDNLPIKQRMVNNLYESDNGFMWNYNYKNCAAINPNMYDSNFTVSDCSVCASKYIYTTNDCFCVNYSSLKNSSDSTTEHSKQIWVDDLRFLINKNTSLKASKTSTHRSSESSYVPRNNTIRRVYKSAKRLLCRFCKFSKYSCKCYSRRTERNMNDVPPYGYDWNYRNGRY